MYIVPLQLQIVLSSLLLGELSCCTKAGPPGSGKTLLARACAAEAGWEGCAKMCQVSSEVLRDVCRNQDASYIQLLWIAGGWRGISQCRRNRICGILAVLHFSLFTAGSHKFREQCTVASLPRSSLLAVVLPVFGRNEGRWRAVLFGIHF